MKFPNEETRFYAPATDVRDRGQADNLDWILRQEGPRGKVLVFAHRYHLSKTAVNATFFVPGGSLQQPAGTYLQRRLGDRLVTIGNLAGKGEVGCAAPKRILESAAPHSIEGLAEHTAAPLFVLDLRAAPAAVANWLNREHTLAQTNETLRVGKAFDILFYVSTMTACGSASRR
jgi:erythromycin esterase-like protein